MQRHLYLFFLFILLFSGCKKENDNPQWDIEVLGPILYASLGLENLIGDSSIIANSEGAQILNYDTIFSDFNLDSIFQVRDTTIPTNVLFPPFAGVIQPGQSFASNNNKITLSLGGVLLKRALISSGTIRLNIKNTLKSKVNFIYSIPSAIDKNGNPFLVTASVDSGSYTDPKFFTGDYDFSGYDVNLTGPTGLLYNSIFYNVNSVADSFGVQFPIGASDTLVNLTTTLINIKPSFASGYLGQNETTESNERSSGIGGIIKSGTVELDSIEMKLDIINYIGADAQAYISFFKSKNTRTGSVVDLNAPSIVNHYLNINRAVRDVSLPDPIIPTTYNITLDNTNSNIREFIENIPDKFLYDLNLRINPLGNISGSNDFVYSDRLIETRVKVKMPLRFAFNQLVLADTLPLTINNATNFDPVGQTTLSLIAENGFPFDMNVQLFLLDSNTQAVIDSLLVPDKIAAAPVDLNYKASGITVSKILIPIDDRRKTNLLSVKRIGIRVQLNTPDYPELIQMYADYRLKLKLIADGTYSIR